jgi:membrane-bound lytic murein transglycosylase D
VGGSISSTPLFHIVEAGETLYGISRKYAVPVEDLRMINDLGVDEGLPIGRKLYLKNPFPDEPSTSLSRNNESNDSNSYILYQVKKGETLYAISRRFNVTVSEIMDWNRKNDYSIHEGDTLRIKRP